MTIKQKTYSARPSEVEPAWHLLDAAGRPMGRLATEVARILQGKDKPIYTPHIMTGDYVIVINAAQVGITGRKLERKFYYHYSGYHGGLKAVSLQKVLAKHPERAIQHAVQGMLPRNALARHMLKRLKIYPGAEHPHQAQLAAARKAPQANTHAQKAEAE